MIEVYTYVIIWFHYDQENYFLTFTIAIWLVYHTIDQLLGVLKCGESIKGNWIVILFDDSLVVCNHSFYLFCNKYLLTSLIDMTSFRWSRMSHKIHLSNYKVLNFTFEIKNFTLIFVQFDLSILLSFGVWREEKF